MIIFLSELQKEHLNLIQKHSIQVLVDFCKLAIDYLNNGINHKKYTVAAEKLDVSITLVQNLVHALVYLIVEGCKHNLSEPDFKSSLAIAGFTTEQQDVLLKFYCTKREELSQALCLLHQKDPRYQDLTWRFEVQIFSRSYNEEIKPMVTMNFVLLTPKKYGQTTMKNKLGKVNNSSNQKYLSPIYVNSSIQDAKSASQCQNIINNVLLQCDLPNLVHLTNILDQALKESKSQHVRKVQRALQ